MKNIKLIVLVYFIGALNLYGLSQAIKQSPTSDSDEFSVMFPSCGSYELLKFKDSQSNGFLEESNQLIEQISSINHQQIQSVKSNDPYVIPVVFHIVYNDSTENLPDSVIHTQMQILNECFRRQNVDTINTRPDFLSLVGDAQIEFVLASVDPNGNQTTGITRTSTNIEYFGGVLPYSSGQNSEINQWVNDSLFPNYFRISRTSEGGIDAWDSTKYLNIWVGDMRTFEPNFNNFEELVFLAFATAPMNFPNWPAGGNNSIKQGVFIHHVCLGGNNPNLFPAPYGSYNGVRNTGKTLVHEVGHYLGLRHIWGDGDCTFDDYVLDTPKASSATPSNCNFNLNSCVDNINGMDLPNMIENYMDYSSENCQNSFTIGQINLMREVIDIYRTVLPLADLKEINTRNMVNMYPNPTNGEITIFSKTPFNKIEVLNSLGQKVKEFKITDTSSYSLEMPEEVGVYLVKIYSNESLSIKRVVKR